jgi:hypothetical protein
MRSVRPHIRIRSFDSPGPAAGDYVADVRLRVITDAVELLGDLTHVEVIET